MPALHYLGVCLINQGWNETAEPLLREALKLRKEVLVENDMRTVDSKFYFLFWGLMNSKK